MREVLVPLAFRDQALIIGSPFRDDEMMTTFGKVAKEQHAIYASLTVPPPWSLFAIVDAPRLTLSVGCQGSVANQLYSASKSWQQNNPRIIEAKKAAGSVNGLAV